MFSCSQFSVSISNDQVGKQSAHMKAFRWQSRINGSTHNKCIDMVYVHVVIDESSHPFCATRNSGTLKVCSILLRSS